MPATAHVTPGTSWFTDGAGNQWSLNPAGNPVINGFTDTVSHCSFLEQWGNVVWQQDGSGAWYSITPTAKITSGNLNWAGPLASPWPAPPVVTGTGPAASSPWLTVDYQLPQTYAGSTNQQMVSRRMYGVSTGGAGDNNFRVLTDPTFQSLAGAVNPGLWWFKDSGQQYWNSDLSVNPASLANLINNFPKLDPLQASGVAMIINWGMVPGGSGNPQRYAQGMANLARYLSGITMSDGRKFPLLLMQGFDEPDGQGEAAVLPYYQAMIPAVKAVNPNILISGPGCAYIAWTDFGAKAPIDVFSYNYFRGGYQTTDVIGAECLSTNNFAPIQDAANTAQGNIQATLYGGLGMDWNCCVPASNTAIGAMFHAAGCLISLDRARKPFWACIWDAFGDGTCGVIKDPNNWATQGGTMQITPKGYLLRSGVRCVHGARWKVTNNAAGLMACATTPSAGHCALMLLNAGRGAQLAKQVALSHMPGTTTGNTTATLWQMTLAQNAPGMDGTRTSVAVNAGLTAPMDFPDPSVSILFV